MSLNVSPYMERDVFLNISKTILNIYLKLGQILGYGCRNILSYVFCTCHRLDTSSRSFYGGFKLVIIADRLFRSFWFFAALKYKISFLLNFTFQMTNRLCLGVIPTFSTRNSYYLHVIITYHLFKFQVNIRYSFWDV